jgi:cytochrome oxidase Cu insertion factor (SCO1/SenC/PrrC family)
MRWDRFVLLIVVSLVLIAPVSAFKGSKLARGPIDDFSLTDHSGNPYDFDDESEGVVVVSFMFTRCPDVCPVITQSLLSVESALSERELADVTFLSISVDPEYDTPEVLLEYAERHGASWPHLTGSLEELEPVWATFGLVVQKAVIDAHTMAYQPAEASLTVVNLDNTSSQHMFALDGTTATEMLAEHAGWSLNTSTSEYGTMLHGIQGVDSPSDWSWYWELNLWNASSQTWSPSDVGMDDIDSLEQRHLAWMASDGNRSILPAPNTDMALSMMVMWPNQTVETTGIEVFSAYHLTEGVAKAAGMNVSVEDSTYGHYLSSINNQSAPEDYAWWWNLYAWNETSAGWESSAVGMDDFIEPHHLLWAPSSTNVSDLPRPLHTESDDFVCNGHGWYMGTGDAKHCMCDAGYGWDDGGQLTCVNETTEDYTVGHSTITYILNPAREPVVAWAGDDWKPEDVASDIRELLEKEQLGGYKAETTPSISMVMLASVVLLSSILHQRRGLNR